MCNNKFMIAKSYNWVTVQGGSAPLGSEFMPRFDLLAPPNTEI
jgi:hypothetical protein